MSITRRAILAAAPSVTLATACADEALASRHAKLAEQLGNTHPQGAALAKVISTSGLDPRDCAMLMLADSAHYGRAPQAFFQVGKDDYRAVSLGGVRAVRALF